MCILTGGGLDQYRSLLVNLQSFWINERSNVCHTSIDHSIEKADVVWVLTPDPLKSEKMHRIKKQLSRARPNIPIINRVENYNFYHRPDAFPKLAQAGVRIPRVEFSDDDLGKTMCVYKKMGEQSCEKFRDYYRGPVEGYRAFEFIDFSDEDGNLWHPRAYYIFGMIRPCIKFLCESWDAHEKILNREYSFQLTPHDEEQIRLIAQTSGLDFFSVDYVHQKSDNQPVILDINVFPNVKITFSDAEVTENYSQYRNHFLGNWHIFDRRHQLRIPEPSGRPFWEMFDQQLRQFVQSPR